MADKPRKGHKGLGMEGLIASWYARTTAADTDEFVRTAQRIAAHLDAGAQVLEIAPGPGYLAIALAKAVPCQVTGLDISHSFVRIAAENARKAGVPVRFQQGDAADLPFPAEQFNFLVCRAAFKNFARPLDALNEMYRVLKAGGAALIIDLRKDYSQQALADYIKDRGRGLVDAMMMKAVFNGMLKRRAYTVDGMAQLVSRSKFMQGDIRLDRIGFELWLKRY